MEVTSQIQTQTQVSNQTQVSTEKKWVLFELETNADDEKTTIMYMIPWEYIQTSLLEKEIGTKNWTFIRFDTNGDTSDNWKLHDEIIKLVKLPNVVICSTNQTDERLLTGNMEKLANFAMPSRYVKYCLCDYS